MFAFDSLESIYGAKPSSQRKREVTCMYRQKIQVQINKKWRKISSMRLHAVEMASTGVQSTTTMATATTTDENDCRRRTNDSRRHRRRALHGDAIGDRAQGEEQGHGDLHCGNATMRELIGPRRAESSSDERWTRKRLRMRAAAAATHVFQPGAPRHCVEAGRPPAESLGRVHEGLKNAL